MGIDRNKATALGLSAVIGTGFFFQLAPFSQGLFSLESGEADDEEAIIMLYFFMAIVAIYSNTFIYKKDLEDVFDNLKQLFNEHATFLVTAGFFALTAAVLAAIAATRSAEDSAEALEIDSESAAILAFAIAGILTMASLLLPLNSLFTFYENFKTNSVWGLLYNHSLPPVVTAPLPKSDSSETTYKMPRSVSANTVHGKAPDTVDDNEISSLFKGSVAIFGVLALIGQVSTVMSQKMLANLVLGDDELIEIILVVAAVLAVGFRTPMNTRNAAAGLRLIEEAANKRPVFFANSNTADMKHKIASYGSLAIFFVNALINGAMSFFGLPAFFEMLGWIEDLGPEDSIDSNEETLSSLVEDEPPVEGEIKKDNPYKVHMDWQHLTLHTIGGATGFFNSFANSSRSLYQKDVIDYLSVEKKETNTNQSSSLK